MSIIGMSAKPETLLFLAWAARNGLQHTMKELHDERQEDYKAPERVLRSHIMMSQPPVFEEDSVYGPIYEALFAHRLDLVEYMLVDWALRGYNAVYQKAAEMEREEGSNDVSTLETEILCESIAQNSRLSSRLTRMAREYTGSVRHVANALRLHFTYRTPLLLRSPESCFLFQEFIMMSLEQVNWVAVASSLVDLPQQGVSPLQNQEKTGDEEARQVALLKEMLNQSESDFGEFSQDTAFASEVREVFLDLTDVSSRARASIVQRERAGTLYNRSSSEQQD